MAKGDTMMNTEYFLFEYTVAVIMLTIAFIVCLTTYFTKKESYLKMGKVWKET